MGQSGASIHIRPSQLGLLRALELKGIAGDRITNENAFYKAYCATGGHLVIVGWLGPLFFHGLIERAFDKSEDWFRITKAGVEFLAQLGAREGIPLNIFPRQENTGSPDEPRIGT